MRHGRRELVLGGLAGALAFTGERTARASEIPHSILDRIGNTPLLQLRSVVPKGHARILLKLESENPTGSMKDRMALAMIEAAERDGRLKPGGGVVEYTGGSTGVSLSLVCRVKGYRLDIVTSDAFSMEKRNHMAALGADLTIVRSAGGGIDAALIRNMIAGARQIVERTGSFWTNQLENPDQIAAYHGMGDEIWRQTGGKVDAFVQSVGTSGSLRGNAERLREHDPDVRIVAVEPSESAVLSGGKPGAHRIEGIGAGFVVPLWRSDVVGEIARVSTEESMEMARRLAKEEGLFAGTSTGANVVVALKKAKELGSDATVVTVMCDSGQKYLSTELYRDGMKAAKEWKGPAE
jgi:cysteine synthase A